MNAPRDAAERSICGAGDLPGEYETILSLTVEDRDDSTAGILEARGVGNTWLYASKSSLVPAEPAFATGDEKGGMNDL